MYRMGEISGERLIALARASDRASRNTLLLSLADLCATRSFGLGEDARTAEDVFLRLARDAELAVRAELSARLASTPWAPRALILMLAAGEIEAAEPVLTGSPVLREADLVDIACRLGTAHRRALARRPGLTRAACEAVARARECDVIRILLTNTTAELDEPALRHCAAAAEAEPGLWENFLRRGDLSEDLVDAAYRAAGQTLQDEIVRQFPQFSGLIDFEVAGAVNAALQARPAGPGLSANERLVQELADSGGLDGDFLVDAIDDGRLNLFELGLARMCECDADTVRRMIDLHGAPGVAMATRAAALEGRHCVRIGAALARCGRLAGGFSRHSRAECADVYRDHTPETARAALRRSAADA
jgi:uncharacterized protein (DUF2336 family)